MSANPLEVIRDPEGNPVETPKGELPKEEGLRRSFWGADGMRRQFRRPARPRLARVGHIATNDRGEPEAFFTYGNDVATREFSVDVYLHKRNPDQAVDTIDLMRDVVVVSVNLLCPRCAAPLLVWGPGSGVGHAHPIHLHWDRLAQSDADGQLRPPLTIEGTVKCEYLDSELTGIASKGRCGWRGVIEKGVARDHFPRLLKADGSAT